MKISRSHFTEEYFQLWQSGLHLPISKNFTDYIIIFKENDCFESAMINVEAINVSDALERAAFKLATKRGFQPDQIEIIAVINSENKIIWFDENFAELLSNKISPSIDRRSFIRMLGTTSAALLFGNMFSTAFAGTTTVSLSGVASGMTVKLFDFTSFTFTNANNSGIAGPSLAQCQSAYSGQTWLSSYFSVTAGIQKWTVPSSGNYTIKLAGAKGGSGSNGGGTYSGVGGGGAVFTGTVTLAANNTVTMLVGQMGGWASFSDGGDGGGGGGTFVLINDVLLAVAGGGGGAGVGNTGSYPYNVTGGDGQSYTNSSGGSGIASAGSWDTAKSGGTSGGGGSAGQGGSGGGGYSGDGTKGSYGGSVGKAYIAGGSGGVGYLASGTASSSSEGGFGGGSGWVVHTNYEANGGGGGGYSGGGGAGTRVGAGGGGGSYASASLSNISAGSNNTGHGYVVITKV